MQIKNKVFCLGLSRTGTTALSHALENLGIPTLHFSLSAFVNQHQLDSTLQFSPKLKRSLYAKWRLNKEIQLLQQNSFDVMLSKFQGFADLPFPLFYKELHKKFPDAKFIYSYRDEKKWLKSMQWLYSDGAVIWKHGAMSDEIKKWAYDTEIYDEIKLLKAYRSHDTDVSNYFKNDPNFLSLNLDAVDMHYKKLTQFLGLPIVDKPIERINAPRTPTDKERKIYWKNKNNDFYSLINLLTKKLK